MVAAVSQEKVESTVNDALRKAKDKNRDLTPQQVDRLAEKTLKRAAAEFHPDKVGIRMAQAGFSDDSPEMKDAQEKGEEKFKTINSDENLDALKNSFHNAHRRAVQNEKAAQSKTEEKTEAKAEQEKTASARNTNTSSTSTDTNNRTSTNNRATEPAPEPQATAGRTTSAYKDDFEHDSSARYGYARDDIGVNGPSASAGEGYPGFNEFSGFDRAFARATAGFGTSDAAQTTVDDLNDLFAESPIYSAFFRATSRMAAQQEYQVHAEGLFPIQRGLISLRDFAVVTGNEAVLNKLNEALGAIEINDQLAQLQAAFRARGDDASAVRVELFRQEFKIEDILENLSTELSDKDDLLSNAVSKTAEAYAKQWEVTSAKLAEMAERAGFVVKGEGTSGQDLGRAASEEAGKQAEHGMSA